MSGLRIWAQAFVRSEGGSRGQHGALYWTRAGVYGKPIMHVCTVARSRYMVKRFCYWFWGQRCVFGLYFSTDNMHCLEN